MSQSIDLSGDKELMKKLDRLAKKDIANSVRKGTREGNKLIKNVAKQNAPVDSGHLKKHVKVKSLKRSRAIVGTKTTVSETDVPYVGPLQFGHKNRDGQTRTEPRPFMFDAVKEAGERATERAAEIIKDEIIKRATQ